MLLAATTNHDRMLTLKDFAWNHVFLYPHSSGVTKLPGFGINGSTLPLQQQQPQVDSLTSESFSAAVASAASGAPVVMPSSPPQVAVGGGGTTLPGLNWLNSDSNIQAGVIPASPFIQGGVRSLASTAAVAATLKPVSNAHYYFLKKFV